MTNTEKRKKHLNTPTNQFEETGKIQPQAREFEEAILGSLLIEKSAIETALQIISAEMFYDRSNELIFSAICELHSKDKPVDLLTVVNQLRKTGTLEEAGGATYIASLSQKVVSSVHLDYHCRILAQKYFARELIRVSLETLNCAFDETADVDDIISEISIKVEKLQEKAYGKGNSKQLSEVMKESITEMYIRMDKYEKGIQSGINTGLADLNSITGGWQKSNLVVIAARPSMGKTSLALHFAKSAAKRGTPVVIFQLEMTDVKLSDRLLMSESNINPNNFKIGKISMEEAKNVEIAVGKLYDCKIAIDANSIVSMDYIKNRSRLLKKQNRCEMIIIDYLQLIEDSGNKNTNREQIVAQISRKAKLLAKELDIPVLLLAQLNREVEKRGNKKPVLSDLRESGAIEQDADLVIFIYREEYYSKDAEKGKGNLIIAKNRDGYTGEINFSYNESMTKIFDFNTSGIEFIPQKILYKNYYEIEKKEELPF